MSGTDPFVAEVHASFGFLVEEAGFTGPEHRPAGPERGRVFVLYRKAGLQVEVPVPGFREPIVGTRLSAIGPDEQWRRGDHGILLPGVYQAAGFGDSSEVPLHLPEDRSIEATALEYVRTHGLIMRRLLPLLLTTDGGLSPWGEDLINGRLL